MLNWLAKRRLHLCPFRKRHTLPPATGPSNDSRGEVLLGVVFLAVIPLVFFMRKVQPHKGPMIAG